MSMYQEGEAASTAAKRPRTGAAPFSLIPRNTWAKAAKPLILVGTHDGEHAVGDGRIGGVVRCELIGEIVIVDFPEVSHAALLDRAEVVFAVRVVVGRETIEGLHLAEHGVLLLVGQGGNALGEQNPAAKYQAATEIVIEAADFLGGAVSEHLISPVDFAATPSRPSGDFLATQFERPGKEVSARGVFPLGDTRGCLAGTRCWPIHPTCAAVVVDVQQGGCEVTAGTERSSMFERVVSWAKGLKAPQQAVEPDLDELAKLIQEGDPSDPATLERIAFCWGSRTIPYD